MNIEKLFQNNFGHEIKWKLHKTKIRRILSSLGEKLVKLKRIYRNVIAQEVGEKLL